MPVDLVAAGAGLVGEPQRRAGALEFADHLIQGLQVAADASVVPYFAAGCGYGYIHGHFMDIQPDVKYTRSHGLPPWLWLWTVDLFNSQLKPRLQGSQAFNF
jgi:hypothetical protein